MMDTDNILKVDDIEMTDDIKKRVIKERLPSNIGETMDEMKAKQSFFLKTDDPQKKLFALRSRYKRWKDKRPEDPHKFSFVQTEDDDGNLGIRVYKYNPNADHEQI
tara:strand:+ start:125 stop:442 length:318 start_codon:yes stop_codon:yes gene_type:complete